TPAAAQRAIEADLKKFERRGTRARKDVEREVRKARTRLERTLRQNRRRAERQATTYRKEAAQASARLENLVQTGVTAGAGIAELEMVRSIEQGKGGAVAVTVSLTTPGCPIRAHFQDAVVQAVGALAGVTRVDVAFDVLSDQEKAGLQRKLGRGSLPAGALA